MEWVVIVLGLLGLVPVAYLVYSRVIRRRHRVDFQVGNVSLARVVSANPRHHDKLAFVTYGLTFVNSGPDLTGIVHLSTVVGLLPDKTSVDIDVKPGSFPNSINLSSGGVVPVAILNEEIGRITLNSYHRPLGGSGH